MFHSAIGKGVSGMSEIKKKKQHFVPRFYLKLFADETHKFYVYDFRDRKIISNPVYYETQCYKNYFYGEDCIWENRLSEMEGKWSGIINKVKNSEVLNEDDIISLKEFVLYQRQRTSAENNRSIEERLFFLRECAKTLYINKGWLYDENADRYCQERAKSDVTPAENLEMATKMVDYIKDLNILIVCFDTDNDLITSDSPVITLNPFLEFQGFGYGNIGIVFLFPITPKHLLIVYDATLYTKYSNYIYVKSSDSAEVEIINNYELIHAERMVFSTTIEKLYVDEQIIKHRSEEESRNKSQHLGPPGHRLIISHPSGVRYYYELKYLLLHRDYRRIPYQCREPIPRVQEEGWIHKLAIKYQVLSLAYKGSKESRELSQSELKLGCRRMESQAKIYWANYKKRFG